MSSDFIWFLGICGTVFTALFSCAYKEPDFYRGFIADKIFKLIIYGGLTGFLSFGITQTFSENVIRKLEKLPEAANIAAAVWEKWNTSFVVIGLFLGIMFLIWCFLEWISSIRKTYLSNQKNN